MLRTESSYPYFQEYVQKHGPPEIAIQPDDEEKGIQRAYQFAFDGFRKIVCETVAISDLEVRAESVRRKLQSFRDALLSISVIVIQLDNEDDAYVVFETLNTRGRDLEPKDLIKNLFAKILRASSDDVDPTKIKWGQMVAELAGSAGNVDTSTYLHHYWLSKFDYTPERTLFDRVKRKVDRTNALDFLDDIVAGVEFYRRIFDPDSFKWKKEELRIVDSLRALQLFKMRQPTPLVFAVLRAYKSGGISLKQASDTLSSIEEFHFSYTAIAGQSSSGGVSKMYAAAARDISNEKNSQKRASLIQDFRKKLAARRPDKDSFFLGCQKLRFSEHETRDRPLIRYVLTKLDELLRPEKIVDYSKMTIEHLAPQNPTGTTGRLETYSTLGNLIFVSEEVNGFLGNRPFPEKKAVLEKHAIPLDSILAKARVWTDSEIRSRTSLIAAALYNGRLPRS